MQLKWISLFSQVPFNSSANEKIFLKLCNSSTLKNYLGNPFKGFLTFSKMFQQWRLVQSHQTKKSLPRSHFRGFDSLHYKLSGGGSRHCDSFLRPCVIDIYSFLAIVMNSLCRLVSCDKNSSNFDWFIISLSPSLGNRNRLDVEAEAGSFFRAFNAMLEMINFSVLDGLRKQYRERGREWSQIIMENEFVWAEKAHTLDPYFPMAS